MFDLFRFAWLRGVEIILGAADNGRLPALTLPR
jgi:hypothetical protein